MTAEAASACTLRPEFLPRRAFQRLLDALMRRGYSCLGPVAEEGAIVYRPVSRSDQFPLGVSQEQSPGRSRLRKSDGERLFAWANGPQALKPLVFAPRDVLWRVQRGPGIGLTFEPVEERPEPTAVIGVRACDLAALAIHDRHFVHGPDSDPRYLARRRSLFLVGVDCTHAADTCFCVSTGDGPALENGYDIGMTELGDGFLLIAGSASGRDVMASLDLQPASLDQLEQASEAVMEAAAGQRRTLPSRHLYTELYRQLDHVRWQQVAQRCLACGVCTSVCPTCFCFEAHAETDLGGKGACQVREWASCHGRLHGAFSGTVVRQDISARYRQWVTHKLAGWEVQQGRSGCVGCGRCITWCPVGIDITAEIMAICCQD